MEVRIYSKYNESYLTTRKQYYNQFYTLKRNVLILFYSFDSGQGQVAGFCVDGT
jgi:hypothetical protein